MWKDYFYFSRHERQGVIILITLIITVLASGMVYSYVKQPYPEIDTSESLKEYKNFMASLRPRISTIPVNDTTPARQNRWQKSLKYPPGTQIDLNEADTAALKMIPGIGSGIARRIVAYRTRLGGFTGIGQLREIEYVSDTLHKWFVVGESPIKRININRASVERMKAHPYINFYQAKAIVEHRKSKGPFSSAEQLKLYEEFSPDGLERLKPYICFTDE